MPWRRKKDLSAAGPEQQGPLREEYLRFLASQAGLDLALADNPPSVPPNPFVGGEFDLKATKTYLRWLDRGKGYADWKSVGTEPPADFLYRLATVRKRAPYLGRVAGLQRVLDRDAAALLKVLKDSGRHLPFSVYVGIYPTGEFNARVEAVGDAGALVLINAGLMDLLFTVLKANLASSGGGKDPPLLNHEQTSIVLAEAFNAYLYGEGSLGAWTLPPLNRQRLLPLEFLLTAGECFVIAHELGHVALGHVRLPTSEQGQAEVALTTETELAADAFALELLVSGSAEDTNAQFLAGGVMNVLALATVLETLSTGLDLETPADETHPDLSERWAQVGEDLTIRFPTVQPLERAERFLGWLMQNELPGIARWMRRVNETMRRPGKYE
jgi:hypothetical protein